MKKFILFLVLGFVAFDTSAQSQAQVSDQTDNKELISEWIDGNYLVRRYKIKPVGQQSQYDMHYTISASKLSDLTKGNATEIADIDKMMASLKNDTTKHVQRVEIKGYASPDGNLKSNEALALRRAEQFREWLDARYALAAKFNVQLSSEAEPWSACDKAVESSSMSDKSGVLAILNSSIGESQKEQKLKAIPQVWSVFRNQILPAMRRVDMTIYYNADSYVEVRTLIEKPAPQPQQEVASKRCCCDGMVVEDEIIGIIVDMGGRNHRH